MRVIGESDPWGMNTRFAKQDGYKPNPNGFYQFTGDHKAKDFPTRYDGCAVKLPWHQAEQIPRGEYSVVFMLRDPREIRKSWELWLGEKADLAYGGEWGQDCLDYDATVRRVIGAIEKAGGSVQTLRYTAVLDNPQAAIESLGWPVNKEMASAVIDPALYRARG